MKDSYLNSQKRLNDILKSIHKIELVTKKETGKSFKVDWRINNIVLYNFSIIGEAIIYVEKEILNDYPHKYRVQIDCTMASYL